MDIHKRVRKIFGIVSGVFILFISPLLAWAFSSYPNDPSNIFRILLFTGIIFLAIWLIRYGIKKEPGE